MPPLGRVKQRLGIAAKLSGSACHETRAPLVVAAVNDLAWLTVSGWVIREAVAGSSEARCAHGVPVVMVSVLAVPVLFEVSSLDLHLHMILLKSWRTRVGGDRFDP